MSPDEEDFLPLWKTSDEAKAWRAHWPGHDVRSISVGDLRGEGGILRAAAAAGMRLGLGVDNALVTIHPLLVLADLERSEAP